MASPFENYDSSPHVDAELIAQPVQNEAGFSTIKTGAVVAAAGVAAGLIFNALGFVDGEIKRDLEIDDVAAGLTSITPIRQQCWLEYGTKVSASAEFKITAEVSVAGIDISQPGFTVPKFKQIMTDAAFSNKVCNEEAAMTLEAGDDNKLHIKMAEDTSFQVTVYPTNPMQDMFESDPNWVAGNAGAVESILKGLPLPDGVSPDGIENIDEALQAVDVVVGSEASAKVCGPVAWEAASPLIKTEIIDSVYSDYMQFASTKEGEKLQKSQFVVDLPSDPIFASQYQSASKELEDTEGMTVSFPDLDELTCDKTELAETGATS